MNSHLVTVEVSVECRTDEGVQTESLTFYEAGLEGLDTQTVQGRSTVQKYRVTLQDIFQNIPNQRILAVHNLLGRLHGFHDASFQNLADDERFEQLGGHIFRQTAFVHVQLGTYHDNRTTGVVHTFTQQVLTETTLLALQTVGEGLERTVVFGLDRVGLFGIIKK